MSACGASAAWAGARAKIEIPVINKACRVRCNIDVVFMIVLLPFAGYFKYFNRNVPSSAKACCDSGESITLR